MDVADAAGEEVDARVGDGEALLGIGDLAQGGDAVLNAADAADLGLDGDALGVGQAHKLGGTVEVHLEVGLMGAVVHDGGKAGLDALEAVLVRAVVEVKGNGHRDAHRLSQGVHNLGNDLEARLPLGGTGGALDDDGRLRLLGGSEDGTGPLKVVGVERGDGVVALFGRTKHRGSANEHERTFLFSLLCAGAHGHRTDTLTIIFIQA